MVSRKGISLWLIFIIFLSISPVSAQQKPRVVVLANSIDYELASDFFGFLENRGIETVHATADDFDQYKGEKFIVILGGPEAPEGVGDLVRGVLVGSEQEPIREEGARKMIVKRDRWAMGQRITILAGPDRHHTRAAHQENRDKVSSEVGA